MTAATIHPPLAALPPLSPNSHPGFELSKRTPHPAPAFAKPLNASGLSTCYYDSRIGPRCTGKERGDAGSENSLDYFGARYFSGSQGRFTSPDPGNAGASVEDPQSWNGYAYAGNNPLRYVDPDGRKYTLCLADGDCSTLEDEEYERWRRSKGNSIFVEPGGVIRDRETERKIGSAQYYDTKPLEALIEAGNRASRVTSTFMIASAAFATAYLGTYAVPATIAALSGATSGSGLTTLGLRSGHDAYRLALRGFTEADISLTKTGRVLEQSDGARVFVKEIVPGKFNVIVEGQHGVVSALKNISQQALERLSRNYGWT